jgi:hypothetical protein
MEKQINNLLIKNNNKIVSNLSFGFWTFFLDGKYEVLFWRPCLRKLFENKNILRQDIQK